MDVRKELQRLVEDVLDRDPRLALVAYRRLARDQLPWLEKRVVALARSEGWNWAMIARLLGVTRSSVHERFKTIRPSVPPRQVEWSTEWEREMANLRNRRRHDEDEDDPIAW